jgi:hypothetical protein
MGAAMVTTKNQVKKWAARDVKKWAARDVKKRAAVSNYGEFFFSVRSLYIILQVVDFCIY